MPDYGGRNDGQCEYSFFTRCEEPTVERVVLEGGGWIYRYCQRHADEFRPEEDRREG